MKPEQERVRNLLTDTVTLLCKNGLQFSKELKVQGTLGITMDENDVFVVHINEIFGDASEVMKQVNDSPKKNTAMNLTDRLHPQPHTRKRAGGNITGQPPGKIASPAGVVIKSEPEHVDLNDMFDNTENTDSTQDADDRNAMQQTYSEISISNIQSSTGTESNTAVLSARQKSQTVANKIAEPGQGQDDLFITSIVKHTETSPEGAVNIDFGPDWAGLALAGSESGSADAGNTPGTSAWAQQGRLRTRTQASDEMVSIS